MFKWSEDLKLPGNKQRIRDLNKMRGIADLIKLKVYTDLYRIFADFYSDFHTRLSRFKLRLQFLGADRISDSRG